MKDRVQIQESLSLEMPLKTKVASHSSPELISQVAKHQVLCFGFSENEWDGSAQQALEEYIVGQGGRKPFSFERTFVMGESSSKSAAAAFEQAENGSTIQLFLQSGLDESCLAISKWLHWQYWARIATAPTQKVLLVENLSNLNILVPIVFSSYQRTLHKRKDDFEANAQR